MIKVYGYPVKRLDPFLLTKTIIFSFLLISNSFCEEIAEIKYKKTPQFTGLLDIHIETTFSEAQDKIRKINLELCCDTSQSKKGCWGNCGNNCLCYPTMEIIIPW